MTKLFLLTLLFQSLIAVSEHHESAQSVAPPIAGGTTPAAPSSAAQEFLDAHNKARAEVGVGPLKWSFILANATSIVTRYQRDKRNCRFANLGSINYGQLQLLFRGLVAIPPQVAVDIWVAEKKFYNYANSCIPRMLRLHPSGLEKLAGTWLCSSYLDQQPHYSNHMFL